ncbi:MAG: hypothetical protein M1827_000100 [Pycnora praestabilis]|nr:MAG: hypothetical protein M1827_000100 [Pycnora praestabilis]
MSAPTLINLPPPPSDPVTPSDMGPGTPNSGMTSMSALSTTAIKDGHQGHAPPHQHTSSSILSTSTSTLDAERADRISRLAGLERVATVRQGGGPSSLTPGASPAPPPGYFDGVNAQQRERSTVGSASATGSVGGRTTWASGSDVYDADKMSEDQDDGVSSTGGFSDEGNASLVGFGEAASSTISGPTSNAGGRVPGRQSGMASPTMGKASAVPGYLQHGSPMTGIASPASSTTTTASVAEQSRDAKMIDGMTYDPDVVDTVTRTPPSTTQARNRNATGAETAERILRERLEGRAAGERIMGSSDEQRDGSKGLGQFYLEEK